MSHMNSYESYESFFGNLALHSSDFTRSSNFPSEILRILGLPGWSWPSLAGFVLAVSGFGLIALQPVEKLPLGLGFYDIYIVIYTL